jgi:serine beta-lactamase-like protein LACTB, mitochondrial
VKALRPLVQAAVFLLVPAFVAAKPAPPAPQSTGAPKPTESPIPLVEAMVSREMERSGIPGLTAALVLNGELQWTKGFGTADIENGVPAKPETVYRIASISKPITATAVMQLAERGKLDLDAPVQKYVPSFPDKPWPITTRQLLGHQGGIRHEADEEWGSTRHYASVEDALEMFKGDPLEFPPGTKAQYSTYGFNLLGSVVEGASGAKFLDYLRENIFAPAGMVDTRADDVFEIIPNRAAGYVRLSSGGLANSKLADTSNKVPGGGLCSTAADIARFAVAIQSGALLKPETLRPMFFMQKTRDGRKTGYGLGWLVGTWRGRREVWHHGGQPQVSTLLYMQPDRQLAIVFLANLEGVSPALTELARELSLRIVR